MQQRQSLALIVAESAGEPVAQRRAERFGASLRLFIFELRFAAAQSRDKLFNLSLLSIPARNASPTVTRMVKGLPCVNRSKGVKSGRSARRLPRCSAMAPASWSRSCIGIGGASTRRGASPSQACSSRREVSRNFAFVSRASREKIPQFLLLGRAPVGRGSGGKARDRLDIVPNPENGYLLEHVQRDPPSLHVVRRAPLDARALQIGAKHFADLVQRPGERQTALETREQHRPFDAARQLIPAREFRRGRRLAAAGKGVQQHDAVPVEGAVERIKRLVAAEEADIRRLRQLGSSAPAVVPPLSILILSGAPSCLCGHRRSGVRSQTKGTHPVLQGPRS